MGIFKKKKDTQDEEFKRHSDQEDGDLENPYLKPTKKKSKGKKTDKADGFDRLEEKLPPGAPGRKSFNVFPTEKK